MFEMVFLLPVLGWISLVIVIVYIGGILYFCSRFCGGGC